jgi:hypothetical protein
MSLTNAGFLSNVAAAMHDFSSNPDDPRHPPIPEVLHSDYTDEAFANCTRCGESLKDFPGGYQVSKAWRRNECVFEYALCDHCRTALMEEFSKESKQRLATFQDEHVTFDGGIEKCSICGLLRSEDSTTDFVLTGMMEGSGYLGGIMVCGKCGEKTQELLSAPTKDTWRRFRDENFDGPPGDHVFELDPHVVHSVQPRKPVTIK